MSVGPGDPAAAADQLRRTLALISGYSQTLLHLQLDEAERRDCLRGMVRAVESLSDQAEEILVLVAGHGRALAGPGPAPAGRRPVATEVRAGPTGDGSETAP